MFCLLYLIFTGFLTHQLHVESHTKQRNDNRNKNQNLYNTMSLSKLESQFPFKPHQWAPLESIPITISGPRWKNLHKRNTIPG